MKKLFVYPYKLGSQSAKQLATFLGAKRVKVAGRYIPRKNHIVVSMGASQTPSWATRAGTMGTDILNKWNTIGLAQNKLTALQILERNGVPVPKFTSSREEAKAFFTQARSVVFCRTLLRAHGGRGIVVARSPEELVYAPLYTKFFPKEAEYRVHVFKGEVIDVAQKRRVNEARRSLNPNRSLLIRNLENGWIYARDGVVISDAIKEICIKSCNLLQLDFGAVDIAVNADGACVVFEVNTAPGLERTTLRSYANAILKYQQKEQEKENAFRNYRRYT